MSHTKYDEPHLLALFCATYKSRINKISWVEVSFEKMTSTLNHISSIYFERRRFALNGAFQSQRMHR